MWTRFRLLLDQVVAEQAVHLVALVHAPVVLVGAQVHVHPGDFGVILARDGYFQVLPLSEQAPAEDQHLVVRRERAGQTPQVNLDSADAFGRVALGDKTDPNG